MPTAAELGVNNVEDILSTLFGLEGKVVGKEYIISCPNPKHTDNRPSCSVNVESGLFHCFSCGIGGDLIRLGCLVLGEDAEHVATLFKPRTVDSLVAQVQRNLHNLQLKRTKKLDLPGPYDEGPYVELRNRGFTQETILRWGIRWVTEDKIRTPDKHVTIGQCYAIPIRDANQHLLAWCYRRTEGSPSWQPKYMYTPGFKGASVWFGCHQHAHADHIVVVEGTLDAIWVDQCGHPAVAALGSDPKNKASWLRRYRQVFVLGDRDDAGARMVTRIGNTLGSDTSVYVARYAKSWKAKDPAELSPRELQWALSHAVSYRQWGLRPGTPMG